ncbi:MAG: hypothetical protein U1G07_03455 [Verrucomicrobiota bacterium]
MATGPVNALSRPWGRPTTILATALPFKEGVLTYDRYDYEGEVKDGPLLRGSQQFGQQLWSDYHWSDRLSAGMGVSISELDVDGGSSQTSEGPEWRVNYTPTPQLSLRAAFGIQFRQF